MTTKNINLTMVIPAEFRDKRLDQALAELFSEHSRERIKGWIRSGACLVNGVIRRPRDKVSGGEVITVQTEISVATGWQAEILPLQLEIIYEDNDLIVINKPANCVVHPGNGNASGTLVNALLQYAPELQQLPRAGIVHRLDKDTTGLLVVARSLVAHTSLVNQLQSKQVYRGYEAIVNGVLVAGGEITEPIGRSQKIRVKMAVINNGKPAHTSYRVLQKYLAHTHLALQLATGRTHQIRVHMDFIRHSIVGDKVYGRLRLPKGVNPAVTAALLAFPRQALHAKKLGLLHPSSGQAMQWEIPLPEDMQKLLMLLQKHC